MARRLKTCYYETLDCDITATEDELRKAYKKAALRWHPDKNQDNLEEATIKFKEIQAAWDVLSDPREKAWYDRHRDEILRGHGDIADVDMLDLVPFFVSSCYSGFGDDENGFYAVYRTVFETIVKEDLPYMEEKQETPPSFGISKSPYEEVHAFYAYWQSNQRNCGCD